MAREHGKHNHCVCKKLHVTTDTPCNDWIITTAFYSSIHFIDHILFPLTHNGRLLNNINEAHNFVGKRSKHETRGFLIGKYQNKFAKDYEYLRAQCWNARYVDYRINSAISDLCVRKLEAIKRDCDIDKV